MIALRNQRQGRIHIQLCNRFRGVLDADQFLSNGIPYSAEHIIFQRLELVLRI